MNKRTIFSCFIFCLLLFGTGFAKVSDKEVTVAATKTPMPMVTPTPTLPINYRIHGINIGPYLDGDPNTGAVVSENDLRNYIAKIAPYTNSIRTFGCGGGLDKAGVMAHDLGLTIAAGAWLGKDLDANEKELACIINMAQKGEVDLAIIGNETLLRGDLTEQQLLRYLERFKTEVPMVPVTTVESWSNIKEHKNIILQADVVAVNMYPYFKDVPVDKAISLAEDWYVEFNHFVYQVDKTKDIIVTETGWPSCGKNGGIANEAFYFAAWTSMARAYDLPFYWFEAYDEAWKTKYEGEIGGCWGLWTDQGFLKKGLDITFTGVVGGLGKPKLEVTSYPKIGEFGNVEGYAWHVIPQDYMVVVYIFVPDSKNRGGWWIKPTYDISLTRIYETGVWICPIVTGGNDDQATKIGVFLIPNTYDPPKLAGSENLPKELYDNAVDNIIITRK